MVKLEKLQLIKFYFSNQLFSLVGTNNVYLLDSFHKDAIFADLLGLSDSKKYIEFLRYLNYDSNQRSEQHELFSHISDNFVGSDLKDVEMNCLGEGSAFSNDCDISDFDIKSWWAMGSQVSVSLLVSVIFRDVVEIISPDNDGPLHFSWDDNSLQNFTSNGNIAGEGTFLIDVVAFDGFFGSFESKSYVFVVPDTTGSLFSE